MNRSERRRQEAGAAGRHASVEHAIRTCLEEGKAHHQAGRFSEADQAYHRALTIAPRHPETLHLLGLLSYRLNRLDEAATYLYAAIEQQPSSPLYWFNLGVVSQKAGHHDSSVTAYEKAITFNPRYLEAYMNLGNVHREQGRLEDSVKAYRTALSLNQSHPEVHNNLGVVLKEQGLTEQAISSFHRALELKPAHLEALNNLGLALMETGTLREAITAFESALSVNPDYHKALYNLGIAWSWAGDDEKAVDCLRRVALAKHDHRRVVADTTIYRSRVKHDAEQIEYLLSRHVIAEEHRPYGAALHDLLETLNSDPSPGNRTSIAPEQLIPVARSFNRILNCVPPPRLEGGALGHALDVGAVESQYLASRPEVASVDGLLNEPALAALRQFCLEATIWKKDYENGYCGAFLGDGFVSPLLLQIADELRLKFPRIFRHHRLTQAWAFKQDSARRGLNIHADAAAVNVNFWITEDEANLNPRSGGLVVYDKEAPKEWNFKEYNSDQNKPKILAWLQDVGAKKITIPYRANRAVIFNSDLFHESDDISFKDGYLSRRINITLLYGYRIKP